MELKNYLGHFDFTSNKTIFKSLAILGLLAVLPNAFGTINFQTPFGVNVHVFQIFIFLAAALFGPAGGAASGLFGSVYTAMLLHNPYILVGNAILGAAAGLFISRGIPLFFACLAAFAVQLPWLWATDVYLMKMPEPVVTSIIIALLLGNIVWALVAQVLYPHAKKSL